MEMDIEVGEGDDGEEREQKEGGEIRKKNKGLKKGVGVKRGWKSGWLVVFE